MKFIIKKEALLDNLQKVLGPTTTKQNFPILNTVLLNTVNNKIKFTTTDLNISIISLQEANIIEQGQAAVSMKSFIAIVRELPPQEITVEKSKNILLIKCENIEFKINTMNSEDFPQTQESKGVSLIKIDPQELEEMIKLTSFCVGYDDTNYVLNGILFEVFENKINLVSTDGKRLSFIQKKLPLNQPEIKTKLLFIVPIKAVIELHRLIKEESGEMYLFVEKNRVGFDFKNTQFTARPIEGEFPNYSQYVPGESKNVLIGDRKKILFALKRANLLSVADHQGVKVTLKKGSMGIYKNTPQLGEVKEVIDIQYNGSYFEIGFNLTYLIDILRILEDKEVRIEFFGPDKPAVFKKEGYIYLLLPMKI